MADVVLVYPKIEAFKNDRPPLGILYLAARLDQEGFSGALVDETVDAGAREVIRDALTESTLCVGISVLTGPQIRGAMEVSAFVRGERPGLPVVWGGCHPTVDPEGVLESGFADAVCIGEGEVTFIDMVRAVRDGTALDGIPGAAIASGGSIKRSAPRRDYFAQMLLLSNPVPTRGRVGLFGMPLACQSCWSRLAVD